MDGNPTTAPTPTGGRRAERKRDARTDGGYILVTLGLMIIPLMAFAALAVDVGSWYARTTELQKAADSAALAGVIWAPDYARARTVAAATLTDNSFTATSAASQTNGNITITMTAGTAPNSFKVCITDAKAPAFFSKVFTNNSVGLTRCATALYYLPVPMGSPLAYFGGDATKYGASNPQTTTTNGSGSDHFPPVNVTGNPSITYTSTLAKNSNGDYKCIVDPAYVAVVGWKYFTGTTTPTGTNTKPTGMPRPEPHLCLELDVGHHDHDVSAADHVHQSRLLGQRHGPRVRRRQRRRPLAPLLRRQPLRRRTPANNDYRSSGLHLHAHRAQHRCPEQHRLPGVRRRALPPLVADRRDR